MLLPFFVRIYGGFIFSLRGGLMRGKSSSEIIAERNRCRIVEDQRCRQTQTGGRVETIAQLYCAQRVEPECPELSIEVNSGGCGVSQDVSHDRADQLGHSTIAFGIRQVSDALCP